METATPALMEQRGTCLLYILEYADGNVMFAYLKVCIFIIERNVDGEGGGVMMGSQVGLSPRCVFNHKVHYSVALQGQSEITSSWFSLSGEHRQQLMFTFNGRC